MEVAVKKYNEFVLDHRIVPVRDPDATSTSLVDMDVLNNFQ